MKVECGEPKVAQSVTHLCKHGDLTSVPSTQWAQRCAPAAADLWWVAKKGESLWLAGEPVYVNQ